MSNSKYRPKVASNPEHSATQILHEKIATRADALYKGKGGQMIESMQYTIGLVLQDFTNDMMRRVKAGDDAKPMVTPYVALRYMKENKALEAERLALLDECLAIATQELDPQPDDPAELLGNKIEKIIAEAIASPKVKKPEVQESKPMRPVLLTSLGATEVKAGSPAAMSISPIPVKLE